MLWSLLVLFVVFSFLGFIAEYVNECLNDVCKFNYSPSLPDIPLLPIYGLGAVFLWLLTPYITKYNLLVQFVIVTLLLTIYEYIAGTIRIVISGKRTWGYGPDKSLVDLKHSIYWGLAGVVLIQIFNYIQTTII